MKASIVKEGAGFTICVNGDKIAPAAYMTYLEKNADYAGFKKAGYKLYCACVYMGDETINETHGLRCLGEHVWKSREEYDFTPVYNSVKKIVADGKEKAYVMLRVNLNVPKWWREENPDELVVLSDGIKKPYMQSVFSKKWREDAKKFLTVLCKYVQKFPFSENVIAIQVAGMQTEEWLALRLATGSFDYSIPAQNAYKEWLKNKYKKQVNAYIPPAEELQRARHGEKIIDEEKYQTFIDYMRFFNEGFAVAIQDFCAHVKQITEGNLLVGVFYGYFGQLPCEYGHNGVFMLYDDKNIDFFASPFAYISGRQTAEDWIYHSAMDTCTRAGKLWFLEADVRTCYTKALYETNPELMEGSRTIKHFKAPTWFGPKTEEETIWVMLRSFAKVLCSGHAFWWFDMWGQWYNSPAIMVLMRRCLALYETSRCGKHNELAVIMDTDASYTTSEEYYDELSKQQLVELGFVGAPYDMYDVKDEEFAKGNYKALLYLAPPTQRGNLLVSSEENRGKEGVFTAGEVGAFLQKAGGHIYSEGNLVYVNDRFVCVTAEKEGEIKLTMPNACKLRGFLDGKVYEGKEFTFHFAYNQTELFEILE